MKCIVLISCVSKKRNYRSRAKDLYISALFQKKLKFARTFNPNSIFILSAKYHLVDLEKEIEPYNQTLNDFGVSELRNWAHKTLEQLSQVSNLKSDKFVFLAGSNYRKYLVSELKNCEIPMEGLKIGQQLQFLTQKIG
ncbi:hypothetical protein QQ008_07485 [Fulvivirgaceae bacterium BMA10]|uniref:DUF6884 domain-containing protein n=1 Tax=Splendidivirga corallicola TaxID=3051826 RepID=A0ABT8KME2_9BACT|nr:hypothetical protein [Fulvivirgaceae bacterium BMA10]